MTIVFIREKDDDEKIVYGLAEGRDILATFPDFETAAIVLRFIRGARLSKAEYDIAIKAMKENDIKRGQIRST